MSDFLKRGRSSLSYQPSDVSIRRVIVGKEDEIRASAQGTCTDDSAQVKVHVVKSVGGSEASVVMWYLVTFRKVTGVAWKYSGNCIMMGPISSCYPLGHRFRQAS